jgi:hypothetical protein
VFVCLCVGVCEYERPALARELYDTNVLDTNLFTEITVCHVAYQYATHPDAWLLSRPPREFWGFVFRGFMTDNPRFTGV